MWRWGENYTYADWIRRLSAFGWQCYWCKTELTEKTAYRDHLQPISRGGQDRLLNIVPACLPCNSRKGKRNEEEYRIFLAQQCAKKSTGSSYNSAEMALKENHKTSWAWKNPARHE